MLAGVRSLKCSFSVQCALNTFNQRNVCTAANELGTKPVGNLVSSTLSNVIIFVEKMRGKVLIDPKINLKLSFMVIAIAIKIGIYLYNFVRCT